MCGKWNKKLGTSKKEQGIVTSKAPQNKPKSYLNRDTRFDRAMKSDNPLDTFFKHY